MLDVVRPQGFNGILLLSLIKSREDLSEEAWTGLKALDSHSRKPTIFSSILRESCLLLNNLAHS